MKDTFDCFEEKWNSGGNDGLYFIVRIFRNKKSRPPKYKHLYGIVEIKGKKELLWGSEIKHAQLITPENSEYELARNLIRQEKISCQISKWVSAPYADYITDALLKKDMLVEKRTQPWDLVIYWARRLRIWIYEMFGK